VVSYIFPSPGRAQDLFVWITPTYSISRCLALLPGRALEPVPSPIGVTTSILGDVLAQLLRVPAAHDVQRETPAGQMVNSRALLGREDRADQLIPDRGPDSDIPKGRFGS